MSDLTLLMAGCAVSFIAVAAAYVYIRECYEAAPREPREKRDESRRLSEVA